MPEVEDTSDDGQWWQIIHDWQEDFMATTFTASQVLFIVFMIMLPVILAHLVAFRKAKYGGKDD